MLVVTPNTCIDVTSWLATLTPGTVSRSRRTTQTAGGKGVNVCRTLRALATDPTLVGLSSQDDPRLEHLLAAEGTRFVPLPHRGPARLALVVLEDDGRVSVVNGRGPEPEDWDPAALLTTVAAHADDMPAVVCSGSLPPGLPEDTYGRVVALAHERGVPCLVDAAPAVLGATLAFGPDLVSPNIGEAEALLHGRVDEHVEESGDDLPERCLEAARALHARGARRAVVTAGSHGAALVVADGAWWLGAASVPVLNPIGAGDSFVAGTAAALAGGAGDVDAVRHGMAVAAAAVQHETGGMLDPALVAPALAALAEPVPA
ncbi:1-phosphofructokinase family hexose kinase [Phycicoccus flavus]|uniref:1-phosphofructokinase n=1 Tax=Phycicoccus flavus TaxID=2502783 RepID=A0A8T6R649_9MICO|nr:PfkB family carbohydrate kinase [Phycicoccus flavus]NHA69114.1 1-phosphofructokinase [Phycicoccus flavus]